MSAVNITAVDVLDNPTLFTNPMQFEIQYECLHELQHDLEWKLIYVGSAESEKYDQVLDSVLVGPVYPGSYRFVFQADPPDASLLPQDDVVGVTVLLLTCSYQGKEFIRVGYYVNNEYADPQLREAPPEKPIISQLVRSILADKPRVTRFPVEFDACEADAGEPVSLAEAAALLAPPRAPAAAPGQTLELPDYGSMQQAAAYGGFAVGGQALAEHDAMEMEA